MWHTKTFEYLTTSSLDSAVAASSFFMSVALIEEGRCEVMRKKNQEKATSEEKRPNILRRFMV